MRFNDRNYYEPPLDPIFLEPYVASIRESVGLDVSRTASWVTQYDDANELTKAVRDVWSASTGILADWSRRISKVGIVCKEYTVLALAVRLDDGTQLLQQAPLDVSETRQHVRSLLGSCPEMLTRLYADAPGLTFHNGLTLCVPEFIMHPLDTLTRVHCGPQFDVRACVHCDLEHASREVFACELAWWQNSPELGFVVLGRDGRVFLHSQRFDNGAAELDVSLPSLLDTLLLDVPMLEEVLHRRTWAEYAGGGFVRPGAAAQQAYDELSVADRAVVTLWTIARVTERAGPEAIWTHFRALVDESRQAVIAGRTIAPQLLHDVEAVCRASEWLRIDQAVSGVVPVTLTGQLPAAIRAWNGLVESCSYPRILITPGRPPPTIYELVLEAITRLHQHAQAGADPQAARAALLRSV